MPAELQEFKAINERLSKTLQYNWNEFDQLINTYLEEQKIKTLNHEYSLRDFSTNIKQVEEDKKESKLKHKNLENQLQMENNQLYRVQKDITQLHNEESNLSRQLQDKTELKQKHEKEIEMIKKRIEEKKEKEKEMCLNFKKQERQQQILGFFIESKGSNTFTYSFKLHYIYIHIDILLSSYCTFRLNFLILSPDQHLQLTFTKIHPLDPEREHILILTVENGRYTVVECLPAIPMEKMKLLVKQVNATNDFAHFVKTVRAQFCLLAKQH